MSPAQRQALQLITDMREMNKRVDEAETAGSYQAALMGLALIARQFLRTLPPDTTL